MRIALNGWFLSHDTQSGSGRYARALLRWLPRVAPEHELVAIAPEAPTATDLDADARITWVTAPTSQGNWGKLLFEQVHFPRACAEQGADLAHVPYWAPPLRSPVPVVTTVHDVIPLLFPEYRGSLLARAYTALVSAAARGSQLVLTDSDASRQDILRLLRLPAERVRAIPLAADEIFQPSDAFLADAAVRQAHQLPEAYVLTLGGFDVRKNVRGLLAAWTWVANALGDSYPLVIAGDPPRPDGRLFPDVRRLVVELGLTDSVIFAGAISQDDLPAVYRGAAVFVYPSRYEGFGLPVLEAMACGTPVVACQAASIPEVAGDAAYLVDPDDTRALGAAILTPIVNPDFAEGMKQRALARAAQFSWERTARETAEAYVQAVG